MKGKGVAYVTDEAVVYQESMNSIDGSMLKNSHKPDLICIGLILNRRFYNSKNKLATINNLQHR
jgi:hypothetical protein